MNKETIEKKLVNNIEYNVVGNVRKQNLGYSIDNYDIVWFHGLMVDVVLFDDAIDTTYVDSIYNIFNTNTYGSYCKK